MNMGLIYATLGEHETAVKQFNAATELDHYLAVAYVAISFCVYRVDRLLVLQLLSVWCL
jgi:hypothetical protein